MNRVLQLAKMGEGAENIFIRGAARLAVSDIHVSSSFAATPCLERRWGNYDHASVRRIHGSARSSLFPAKDQIGGQLRRHLIVETCAEPVKMQRLSDSDSGIIEVTLDRPGAMNAIGNDTLKYLQRILETLNEDSSARVVMLCSSLPKVFCAGADLKERRRMNVSEVKNFVSSLRSTFSFLETLSVPTIAVIEGAALGGGLELALSCDLRVCGDAATFGMPETGLAIIPGFYKFSQNDSETGTETKFWFQLCEQMVFNHDQPVCFRCQTCGGPLHCGLTCSALMAKNVAGYYICTTLGHAANFKVSLIDMKNPGKGVRLNMSASSTDGDCSLSVSVYCNTNGVQAPISVSKSGDCNYATTMMHPAGCPAVTSIGGKGLGWLSTLLIVLLCVFTAYLLTGIVYRFFVLGIHGKEVVPNLDFWLSVPKRIQNGSEYILIRIVGAYYRVRYGPYTRV